MNNKGQAVLAEHVMIFFVVIAALVVMTTFVQRGLEARIHNLRNYMVDSVSNACDANCQQASGNGIYQEYEPYYSQVLSDVDHKEQDYKAETNGSSAAIGSIYYSDVNEENRTISTSVQLPPLCAGSANGNCQLMP